MSTQYTASVEANRLVAPLNAVEVLELTTDCFVALDRDLRITYVNQAAARLNGIDPAEAIGRTHGEQWPASVGTEIEGNYLRAIETGAPVHFQYHYRDAGVLDLWLDVHAYPTDSGLAIFFRDITSAKNDEQALRESLAREEAKVQQLQLLMDSVPAAVWIMEDLKGERITGSRLSYELLRLPVGVNASVTAPPPERPNNFRVCYGTRDVDPEELPVQRAAWENREIRGAEFDVVFDDGTRVQFYGNAVPVRDADGAATGSIAAFLDVTELKKTQSQLRRSLSRLELALNVAGAGAWEWDAATDERKWTPELFELFGLDKSIDPSQEALFELIHTDDIEFFKESVRRWRSGIPNEFQFRLHHPRKGLRWLEISGRPLFGQEGNVKAVVGVVVDVTGRKEIEQELERRVQERTEQLIAANQEMEGFTYSVSHDLRAPLRAIVANSRMLLDDLREGLDEDHIHMLERQFANANKLGQLIDELLKMSRLGRQEMVESELDMSQLASHEAEQLLANGPKGLSVEIDPGMKAHGDERLVRFIFQNLIGNAGKFSPHGGCVRVGQEALESGETAFFVRDEGIGFNMDYVSKLFKPFERLVTDKEFAGTGIGLANVKRIANRHGGRVWAHSDGEGKGATFWFTLG